MQCEVMHASAKKSFALHTSFLSKQTFKDVFNLQTSHQTILD